MCNHADDFNSVEIVIGFPMLVLGVRWRDLRRPDIDMQDRARLPRLRVVAQAAAVAVNGGAETGKRNPILANHASYLTA